MKRYLIMGALALAAGAMTTSCSNDDEFTGSEIEAKMEAFDQAFREAYGQIDTNQDWGWATESANARTRTAATNANQWYDPDYYGYQKPAAITQREREVVSQWYKDHKKGNQTAPDFTTFFVQQVYYGDNNYSCTDSNGANHTFNCNGHMDQISANMTTATNIPTTNQTSGTLDHVNNFNTLSGSIMLMENSNTKYGFGYWESAQGGKYYANDYFYAYIEVDGVGAWYCGFDYESHGGQGDIDPNGYHDDRIIKIVPAEKATTTEPENVTSTKTRTRVETYKITSIQQGRVFCEDLGVPTNPKAVDKRDFDYNDVVFDAYIYDITYQDRVSVTKLTYNSSGVLLSSEVTDSYTQNSSSYTAQHYTVIKLLAAGGTYTLRVGPNSAPEVHEKFGVTSTTMVNTVVDGSTLAPGSLFETKDPVTYTINQSYSSLYDIPVYVKQKNKDVVKLTAVKGNVPQKVCVPIGTAWPRERCAIDEAYTTFASWVGNSSVDPWTSRVADKVWNGDVTGDVLPATKEEYVTYNESDDTVVDPDVTSTEGSTVFNTVTRLSEDNSVTISASSLKDSKGTEIKEGSTIRVYGTSSTPASASVTLTAGSTTISTSSARPLTRATVTLDIITKTYVLTEAEAEAALTSGLTISGRNFTLKCVTVENPKEPEAEPEGDPYTLWDEGNVSGEANIYIDSWKFFNASEGDVIRVYGTITDPGWSINFYAGEWTEMGYSYKKDSNTSPWNGDQTYYQITLTAENIQKIKKDGKLRLRTYWISNTQVVLYSAKAVPVLSDGPKISVWTSKDASGQELTYGADLKLPKEKFANCVNTSRIIITGVSSGDWKQIHLQQYAPWNSLATIATAYTGGDWSGSVEFMLGDNVDAMKEKDTYLAGGSVKITKVELIE